MNSMHGFWVALARHGGHSWFQPSWWPYWDCGALRIHVCAADSRRHARLGHLFGNPARSRASIDCGRGLLPGSGHVVRDVLAAYPGARLRLRRCLGLFAKRAHVTVGARRRVFMENTSGMRGAFTPWQPGTIPACGGFGAAAACRSIPGRFIPQSALGGGAHRIVLGRTHGCAALLDSPTVRESDPFPGDWPAVGLLTPAWSTVSRVLWHMPVLCSC